MDTKKIIDRIFKEPGIQYELTEFENLGKPIHEIISIYPRVNFYEKVMLKKSKLTLAQVINIFQTRYSNI